jgi:uncharacterized cupin superfamily protein
VSHPNIAHWDDVEEHEHEEGSIHSAWRYLGEAAGTVGVGVNRIRIHPGCRSTPLHSHGDHEEIFFVLGGSGLSWQRTERGEDVVCEVGPGTCLVHLATGPAHTLVAGPDGLDVLAYGNGRRSGAGNYDWFPRIEKVGMGPSLFDVDLTHQWELEGALPEPELPEPGSGRQTSSVSRTSSRRSSTAASLVIARASPASPNATSVCSRPAARRRPRKSWPSSASTSATRRSGTTASRS